MFAILVSLLLFFPVYSDRSDYSGKVIDHVEFVGIKNVSQGELYSIINLQPGFPLSDDVLNQDIKALFGTGYFSNVVLRARLNADDSITIIFEITELPRISEINYRGVEELYPADLNATIPIRAGDVYSPQKVQEGVMALKRKYREEGFFLAEVWQHTGELDEATNSISVLYVVDEGEDIPIGKINILGTRNLNPDDILEVLEQKEETFFENGTFLEGKFEDDKYRILAFAKSQGFLDADIDPAGTGYEIRWINPTKPEDGRVVVITYKIVEGDIRYFGGYSLEHDPAYINQELNPPERRALKPDDLRPILVANNVFQLTEFSPYDVGKVFDEGKFFRDRSFLQEIYAQRGYVFAQIQPVYVTYVLDQKTLDEYQACLDMEDPSSARDKRCKEEAGWINLDIAREHLREFPEDEGRILRHSHFVIRENRLAYIENIIVKGMVKTQESVIRRELLVKEGQLYNSALVNRSREKLINLGYFKEVNLQMRPGSDDSKMNLIIDVEEQPTGTISMGGGYGTASGFSIFLEGGETNLNGTGQRITGKFQYGPETSTVSVTWTDPWFFEACLDTTGSFWRNKQRAFDNARSFQEILQESNNLRNDYESYGKSIREFVDEEVNSSSEPGIESLDRVKSRIRGLLHDYVANEESCARSMPRPWAFSISSYYQKTVVDNSSSSIKISDDTNDFFEGSSYEISSVGVGFGISHTFLVNWAHYHRYSPSWSEASRPTSLVNNEVLKRTSLGWQFKSSVTNGIVYDSRDNVFNTTSGFKLDLSIETVGQMLGGDDHYNQYTLSTSGYWWWFDYTFGGLFRRNSLRKWRVVQEVRFSGIFTHETAPFYKDQDKEVNPYLEVSDRLILGGYETVRGYDYNDEIFPAPWQDGANHMLLFSTETRFPIEPSILWAVVFFDAGALYDNVGETVGEDNLDWLENYRENMNDYWGVSNPAYVWLYEHYSLTDGKPYFYNSYTDWHDPKRAVLSRRNVALDRAVFSWGFGIRIQIAVLPEHADRHVFHDQLEQIDGFAKRDLRVLASGDVLDGSTYRNHETVLDNR